ncbi:MAG: Hsp20/alpha crystallin family protein [Isosphaeraceae bacterium]|nr:Hsp20/alpha crystallin family protein [Isosphaeraceae bacterium]
MAPTLGEPINRLDALFDRLLSEDDLLDPMGSSVPLAMWEDEDHIYVEAELPGLTDKDVEIMVHNGMLFIRGERKREQGRSYLYNGRSYGRFERVITLPEAVDTEAVQAKLTNGVLSITFPKSPEAKPKKIALQTC